jgi:hypothetical protein
MDRIFERRDMVESRKGTMDEKEVQPAASEERGIGWHNGPKSGN